MLVVVDIRALDAAGSLEQLSQALGLGGRGRNASVSPEKARQAVTWRVRAAIRTLEHELPACGRHLQRSVQTGVFCSYDPEIDPRWIVEEDQ